jgi:anionic cell wall polymer biosynthesis LytR-Cps2A-Psr (LCP) family protein
VIDLQLIERAIDAIDGVDVVVKEDIYDPKFPTRDRGYETFSISAGPQHLDGKTAIKYIRSRHQAQGDFSRIERQQQVMDAIRAKALDPKYLPKLLTLFSEFQGKTNIGLGEIKTMAGLAKNFPEANINYFLIDAGKEDSLLVYGKTILGKNVASVLWPKAGKFDYSEIREEVRRLGD